MLVATAAKFNIPPERIAALRGVTMGRAPQPSPPTATRRRTVKENFEVVREGWMEQIQTDPRVRYTDMVACDADAICARTSGKYRQADPDSRRRRRSDHHAGRCRGRHGRIKRRQARA